MKTQSSALTASDCAAVDAGMCEASPTECSNRRTLDLIALALTPWTILIQGSRLGVGSQDFLIATLRRMNDAQFLVNDWRLSVAPQHPQFMALLAPISAISGEIVLFLTLQMLTRLLLLMGVWRLADALAPRAGAVAVGLMMITVFEIRLQVGLHYLQTGAWEPAHLGMALGVWVPALGFRFIGRRAGWLPFAIAAGVGIFAHLFIVGPIFGIMWIVILWLRRDWAIAAKMLAVALLLGAPSWLPAALGFFGDKGPLTSQQVIQLLQFRHPHHHQPWKWPPRDMAQAAIIVSAAGVSWWRLLAARRAVRFAGALCIGYFVASCAAFWIFGRLQRVEILAYMQSFRLLSFMWLAAMAAMGTVLWDRLPSRSFVLTLCAMVATAMVFWINLSWLRAIIVLATAALARPIRSEVEERPVWAPRTLLAIATVGAFALITMLQWGGLGQNFVQKFRSDYWLTTLAPQDPARAELVKFVRENTAKDSLFVIPPNLSNFRIWEERAVVVDTKNVPYDNAGWAAWAERYRDVTGVDTYAKFTVPPTQDPPEETLVNAAKKYGARYVVVTGRRMKAGGQTIFANGDFAVLDLNAAP